LIRASAAVAAALLAASCAGQATDTRRSYENRELGFAITLPPGWTIFGDEVKSEGGTLVNWQIKSLEGADPAFLAGLPESVVPQLEGWTRHYFGTFRDEGREPGTVGSEPALVVTQSVTVPRQTAPSTVRYWVCRRGQALYMVRAVYPAGREREEDAAVRELLASWRFTEPTGPLPF
jgi:hypothetical protein